LTSWVESGILFADDKKGGGDDGLFALGFFCNLRRLRTTSCWGIYDKKGALEAQKVFDEKYKTNDYYSRVYTGIEEMPVNELKLAIDKG